MNKIVLIIAVFILFSCNNSNKKQKYSLEFPETQSFTEIKFEEEIHDLGILQAGEIVVYSFRFTNIGNQNLIIKKIETDCDCVKTKFSEESIPPNSSSVLEVIFNSSGLFGKQFKTIEFYSNTKEPKQLAIFAEVKNNQIEIKY